jgi:hypothetical protein
MEMAALGLLMFTRGGLQQAPFEVGLSETSGDNPAHWALAFIVGGITAAPSRRP